MTASISVSPSNQRLVVGGRLQYQALYPEIDGSYTDVTALATWSSSNSAIASIQSLYGLAQALAEGTVTITASYSGMTGTAELIVEASDDVRQIVAFASLSSYRNAEYKSRRYKFPYAAPSCIKVLASKYPVKVDVIYPAIPITLTVNVTSEKPQRIKPYLVNSCEIKFLTDAQISAIYLSSRMDEIPL